MLAYSVQFTVCSYGRFVVSCHAVVIISLFSPMVCFCVLSCCTTGSTQLTVSSLGSFLCVVMLRCSVHRCLPDFVKKKKQASLCRFVFTASFWKFLLSHILCFGCYFPLSVVMATLFCLGRRF